MSWQAFQPGFFNPRSLALFGLAANGGNGLLDGGMIGGNGALIGGNGTLIGGNGGLIGGNGTLIGGNGGLIGGNGGFIGGNGGFIGSNGGVIIDNGGVVGGNGGFIGGNGGFIGGNGGGNGGGVIGGNNGGLIGGNGGLIGGNGGLIGGNGGLIGGNNGGLIDGLPDDMDIPDILLPPGDIGGPDDDMPIVAPPTAPPAGFNCCSDRKALCQAQEQLRHAQLQVTQAQNQVTLLSQHFQQRWPNGCAAPPTTQPGQLGFGRTFSRFPQRGLGNNGAPVDCEHDFDSCLLGAAAVESGILASQGGQAGGDMSVISPPTANGGIPIIGNGGAVILPVSPPIGNGGNGAMGPSIPNGGGVPQIPAPPAECSRGLGFWCQSEDNFNTCVGRFNPALTRENWLEGAACGGHLGGKPGGNNGAGKPNGGKPNNGGKPGKPGNNGGNKPAGGGNGAKPNGGAPMTPDQLQQLIRQGYMAGSHALGF